MKKIIYIYGGPGCGKSYLANQIIDLVDDRLTVKRYEINLPNKIRNIANVILVESYRFSHSTLRYIMAECDNGTTFIFVSQDPPPMELYDYIVKIKVG